MKQENQIKTPQQMFEEKQKRIEKYVHDKDLNIRVSWAINCAVEVNKLWSKGIKSRELLENHLIYFTDFFLNLFKKKQAELVQEKIREANKQARILDFQDEQAIADENETLDDLTTKERSQLTE